MDILIILVIILFFLIMVMLYMFVKKFSEQNEIIFKEINKLKQQIKDDLPKYNNDLIKNQLEKTFKYNENNTCKKQQDIQVNKNNIEDINNKELNNNIINNQTIINDVDKDIKLNSEDINEYPNPQDLLSDNNNEIKNENKIPLEEIEQQYLNKIKNDYDKKHKEDEELEELHNEIEESINNMNNEEEIDDDIDKDNIIEENNNKFINDIISLQNIIESNISNVINQEYNNKEPGALAPAKSSLCEDEPGGETSCLKGINSLEHIIEEVNDEEDIKNKDNKKEEENEINNNDNNIIKEIEEIKEENETLYNNEILDDLINGPYKYQELVKKCKEYNIIVAKMKKKEIIDLLQSLKK